MTAVCLVCSGINTLDSTAGAAAGGAAAGGAAAGAAGEDGCCGDGCLASCALGLVTSRCASLVSHSYCERHLQGHSSASAIHVRNCAVYEIFSVADNVADADADADAVGKADCGVSGPPVADDDE